MFSRLSKTFFFSVVLFSGLVCANAEKEELAHKVPQKIASITREVDPYIVQQFEQTLDAYVKEGQGKTKEAELKERMALVNRVREALMAVKAGDEKAIADLFFALNEFVTVNQQKISNLERENSLLRVSSSLENKKESTFDTAMKYIFLGGTASIMTTMVVVMWRDILKKP